MTKYVRSFIYLLLVSLVLVDCKPKTTTSEERIKEISIFLGFKLGSKEMEIRNHLNRLIHEKKVALYRITQTDTVYQFNISENENDTLKAKFMIENNFYNERLSNLSFSYTYRSKLLVNEIPKSYLLETLTEKYGEPALKQGYKFFPVNAELEWTFDDYIITYSINSPVSYSKIPHYFTEPIWPSYNDIGEILISVEYQHRYLSGQARLKEEKLNNAINDSIETKRRTDIKKAAENL